MDSPGQPGEIDIIRADQFREDSPQSGFQLSSGTDRPNKGFDQTGQHVGYNR
jgi:hypothetical protein